MHHGLKGNGSAFAEQPLGSRRRARRPNDRVDDAPNRVRDHLGNGNVRARDRPGWSCPSPLRSTLTRPVRALDRLLAPSAEWCCYPAPHIELSPDEVMRPQRAGFKRGWPDFLIVHRQLFGVECKRHGQGLSKTCMVRTKRGAPRILVGQEELFPRLLASRFADIAVINTVD